MTHGEFHDTRFGRGGYSIMDYKYKIWITCRQFLGKTLTSRQQKEHGIIGAISSTHTCTCMNVHTCMHTYMYLWATGYVCRCSCMCTDGGTNQYAHAHAKMVHARIHPLESSG